MGDMRISFVLKVQVHWLWRQLLFGPFKMILKATKALV